MLASGFGEIYGEGLEAKVTGAKLPTPLYLHSAVYDENDSAYILVWVSVVISKKEKWDNFKLALNI
jgi:hypothetical protein